MKYLAHQMAKDIRYLRVPLLLWFFLAALQATLVGSVLGVTSDDVLLQGIFEIVSFLLPLLKVVLACIIVALLIHQEPLVGTEAFWLTRPISRGSLLGSKICFIALFLILPPLMAELAVMFANGVTLRHILLAIPEILLEQSALFSVILVVAVVSRNFARFALAGVMSLVLLVLVFLCLSLVALLTGDDEPIIGHVPLRDGTSAAVLFVVTIGMGLLVVVHQYFKRRTKRSVGIALFGATLALLTAAFWPWRFLRAQEPSLSSGLFNPEVIRLVPDTSKTWISDTFSMRRKQPPRKNVAVRLEVQGVPPGYAVEPIRIDSRLEFADRTTVRGVRTLQVPVPREAYEGEPHPLLALRSALGEARIMNIEGYRYQQQMAPVFLTVGDAIYSRYGKEAGAYSADFDFRVSLYEAVSEMPLQKGAYYDKDSQHVVITDVLRRSQGCTVILRESSVNLLFDERPEISRYYLLRNQERREAFLANAYPLTTDSVFWRFGSVSMEPASGERMIISYIQLQFPEERWSDQNAPVIDERWLAGARLVRVEVSYAGRFSKALSIPGFKMDTR
jgi:ABC-type transport system involved in multi-copper enzyme maturation permease subunit